MLRIFKSHANEPFRLNRKLLTFLMCILVSSLFWILNAFSKKYTVDLAYPVQYINEPSDKVITGSLPAKFLLTIKGAGYSIFYQKLVLNEDTIKVDLSLFSRIKQNDRQLIFLPADFYLEHIKDQIHSDLQIVGVKPDTLLIEFTRRKTKMVPVKVNLSLSFKKQYQLKDSLKVVPSAIGVSGPADVINRLKYFETDSLALSDISENVVTRLPLKIPEEFKSLDISSHVVHLTIPVEKYTEETFEITPDMRNIPMNSSLILLPAKVKVTVLVPFSKYSELKKTGVNAYVDYNEVTLNRLPVKVNELPAFAKVVKITPPSVEFILQKKK